MVYLAIGVYLMVVVVVVVVADAGSCNLISVV